MNKEIVLTSQEIVRNFLNALSDEQRIFLFGIVNLNQQKLVIDLDLDDTGFKTAVEVLKYCDQDIGTNYSQRKITGWSSISKWLVEDGIFDKITAEAYEEALWTDPDILGAAKPNEALQRLSYAAAERNIPQFITTSRIPELWDTTRKQRKEHFPWIPEENINHRTVINSTSEIYKASSLKDLSEKYPNLLHFDDSMSLVRLVKGIPVSIIGFPKDEDDITDLWASNRVFFKDQSILNGLIYYPSINVAQSY